MAQSYQEKYFFFFRDTNNIEFTVQIHKLADNGTVTTSKVVPASNPFTVTLPSLNNKLQSVRGTGCQINLISETNMQFIDLYTANIFEYQIRVYKGSALPTNLVWLGYLDSELYTEPFNELTNYEVSFSGSDGFALLDRMTYLNAAGDKYTGITTQYTILQNILTKIGLPFSGIRIAINTTIDGVTLAAAESIFHKTCVINDNFYDEDGVPFNLRKVLESIIESYGAFIQLDNGVYNIFDVHTIANASTASVKIYDSSFTYTSTNTSFSNLIGDLGTIKFAASDSTLNIIPAINKQVVKYSPYKATGIIDYDTSEDFTNFTGTISYNGATNYQWTESEYSTSKAWTASNYGKFMRLQGTDGANTDVTDNYLDIINYGNYWYGTAATKSFTYKKQLPYILGADGYKLKIELSIFPRVSNDLNNTLTNNQVSTVRLVTRLKIGSKKYSYAAGTPGNTWVDAATNTTTDFILPVTNRIAGTGTYAQTYAAIEDRWTDFKLNVLHNYDNGVDRNDFLVPLPTSQITGGLLEFEIYGYQVKDMSAAVRSIPDVRIKNVKITVVDSKGNDVSVSDTEYVGYINQQYKNEGDSMELIQGTNVSDYPIERGGLLKTDGTYYSWIKLWNKAGKTQNIENLVLRSYVGNYENKSIEVSATTNILPTAIGYLTYSAWLSGKKFMITSLENNYAEATSAITMQEIFVDALDINKSF